MTGIRVVLCGRCRRSFPVRQRKLRCRRGPASKLVADSARRRERYAADSEYRAKVLAGSSERHRRRAADPGERERLNAKSREFYATEEYRAWAVAYRERNRERIRLRMREWRARLKAERAAGALADDAGELVGRMAGVRNVRTKPAPPAVAPAELDRRRAADRERNKAWRVANPDAIKARQADAYAAYKAKREEQRAAAGEILDRPCVVCETVYRARMPNQLCCSRVCATADHAEKARVRERARYKAGSLDPATIERRRQYTRDYRVRKRSETEAGRAG